MIIRNGHSNLGHMVIDNKYVMLYRNAYILGLARTLPVSQAGHHTHHTTTCVHVPFTFHPNEASASMSVIEVPVCQAIIHNIIGGDKICRTTVDSTL